jgi:hypothetical protein
MTFDEQPTMPGSIRPAASLVVRQGTQAGVTFPLTRDQLIIGRQEGVEIVLQDAEVSRRHAQISWQADDYVIHDLGSTNGVFVNGIEITAPQPLQNGDSVRLGQTTLIFQLTDLAAAASLPGSLEEQPAVVPVGQAPFASDGSKRRWLWLSCGCLVLLCVCVSLVVFVAYSTGRLDNVAIINDLLRGF